MIVIACHNKIDLLQSMINRLNDMDLKNHKILLVNTNSDDQKFVEYFNACKEKYNFIFDTLNYTCFDSGAYIYAYNTYKTDKYIFLQDSIIINNEKFISNLTDMLDIYDVVPLFNFKYIYDNDEQKKWAEDGLDTNNLPEYGIFGPMFAVKKATLDSIPTDWLKYPTQKNQSLGMERRWSLMFHQLNANKKYLHTANDEEAGHITAFIDRNKQYITKLFFWRN
jgi:hypothetical protein